MRSQRQPDAVDTILEQWRRERPDLEVSPMGPIGRLKRCAALLQLKLDKIYSEFGLSNWEFDVLATLRRSGDPYCLTPTALFAALMITSGTMTHRIQRLEAAGWVQRIPNRNDARSMLVQLTPAGLELIDRAVKAHVENEREILTLIQPDALAALDERLAELLSTLETPKDTPS
ncbi:MarR family transcriptional regulator [Advenella sp. S44]|uniref:MarR family winged helix-turn-helix transcriptional regulator n=1 Tax=Advenella sp. S44 TaxID=1982755 RepID=UPI000C29E5D4|nr:MarR family transcriptional regulator [Advenella sp. S44]PJX21048.1 MarR family transcriptional regulator [Advenella sp. S44]